MTRSMVVTLLVLIFAFPAFAKSNSGKQPISCSDLWIAVSETLGNRGNYTVVASDPDRMRASFIVVGGLYSATNLVFLNPGKKNCELNVRMGFTGNDDESAFRGRVGRSLKKQRAANPPAPAKPEGTL